MDYFVYVHTCPNGKRYVGCTIQEPEQRWKRGTAYRLNKPFAKDVLKFGWERIQHDFWKVNSEEEMKFLETYLIRFYFTTNPEFGYNKREGGLTNNRLADFHRIKIYKVLLPNRKVLKLTKTEAYKYCKQLYKSYPSVERVGPKFLEEVNSR